MGQSCGTVLQLSVVTLPQPIQVNEQANGCKRIRVKCSAKYVVRLMMLFQTMFGVSRGGRCTSVNALDIINSELRQQHKTHVHRGLSTGKKRISNFCKRTATWIISHKCNSNMWRKHCCCYTCTELKL